VTLHGSDVRLARSPLARFLMRRVLRRSSGVTAVSHWLAGEAVRIASVGTPLIAPMPVETDLFRPANAPRDGLLFVGKLDAQKGLHVLLDAMTLLPERITLTVVGGGAQADRLRAQADLLGLGTRVRWCGMRTQPELPAYYSRAKLVVAPATEPEGLGLVVAEALLCETPVIASDLGGLRDLVEDNQTGRLVRHSDPAQLALAISAAEEAPEVLKRWGEEGRRRVLARFTPAASAVAYGAIYEDLLRAARS